MPRMLTAITSLMSEWIPRTLIFAVHILKLMFSCHFCSKEAKANGRMVSVGSRHIFEAISFIKPTRDLGCVTLCRIRRSGLWWSKSLWLFLSVQVTFQAQISWDLEVYQIYQTMIRTFGYYSSRQANVGDTEKSSQRRRNPMRQLSSTRSQGRVPASRERKIGAACDHGCAHGLRKEAIIKWAKSKAQIMLEARSKSSETLDRLSICLGFRQKECHSVFTIGVGFHTDI